MNLSFYKRNYYYLIAGLPDLVIDQRRLHETGELFKDELIQQVNDADYKLVKLLYLGNDNKNLLNLLLKRDVAFLRPANYGIELLKEEIVAPGEIENYLVEFIALYHEGSTGVSGLNHEKELLRLYYAYVLEVENDFLKQWLKIDMDVKNVLTAINCRAHGYSLEQHLVSVGQDDEVYRTLMKWSPKAEFLTDEIPFIDSILSISTSRVSMMEKEKAIDRIKWEFVDEWTSLAYFNIENILGFVIKLNIAERWMELDNETGGELLRRLLDDIKMSYKFPREFDVKSKITIH